MSMRPTPTCFRPFGRPIAWLVAVFAIATNVAGAQTAEGEGEEEDPWAGIEEMLVVGSAEGVLGALQETGSITGFTADDLQAYGIENTTDLSDFTPNLEIVQNSATTATFFIRGVGLQDFSSNAQGAVAVYLDGMPVNAPTLQIAPLFDLQGVDVLRGPQGSGNWRNATAGVIAIQTRKPSLTDMSFNAQTAQGSFLSDDAVDSYKRTYELGATIPLVQDVFSIRLSGQYIKEDPYFTNRCARREDAPGVSVCGEGPFLQSYPDGLLPRGLRKNVGEKDVVSARSTFVFEPPTDLELRVVGAAYFSRRDQDGQFGVATGTGSRETPLLGQRTAASDFGTGYREPDNIAEFRELNGKGFFGQAAQDAFEDNFTKSRPLDTNPYEGDFNRNGLQRVEIWGGNLDMSLTLGDVEITSNAGALRLESTVFADTDLIPNTLFEIDTENRVTQVSYDLVARGEVESADFRWELGGYVLVEDLETKVFQNLATFDSARAFEQDTLSYAVFGGFDVDFWDDFTFSAGARLNTENKQFEITDANFDVIPIPGVNPSNDDDEKTFREPTGTLELLYRFDEGTSAYLKFNRGFKPHHFNANGTRQGRIREIAKPETINSFEFGLKGAYWDERVTFSGSLFHYDYKDYQVFIFEDAPTGPPTLQVINANDARVLGAEIDLIVEPLVGYVPSAFEGLRLTLRGGWLDSKFLDFQNKSLNNTPFGVQEIVTDYSGNQLLNSPEFQVSGGVLWTFDIPRIGEITPRWDFSWTDDSYFDPSEGQGAARRNGSTLPEFTLGQREYIIHNVRLALKPRDSGIEVAGWCRNVADERYKTYAFDVSRFRGVVVSFVSEPRSCGADLNFTW